MAELLAIVYLAEMVLLVAAAVLMLFTAVAFRGQLLYAEAVALLGLSFFLGVVGWLFSSIFPLDVVGTSQLAADVAVLLSAVGYLLAIWFLARDFLGGDGEPEFETVPRPEADEETPGFEGADR